MDQPFTEEEQGRDPLTTRLRLWQSSAVQAVGRFVYPPRCPVSDRLVQRHDTLAPEIWSQLKFLAPPWCAACGWPFPHEGTAQPLCVTCAAPDRFRERLTGPRRLDQYRAALAYDDVISGGILKLKYADRSDGVALFARLMMQAGREILTPDSVLVPVPLHPSRLAQRRYNQAGLLAAAIGRQASLDVLPRAVRRARKTPPQKGGSRQDRARNVRGAFALRQPERIEGRTVVLIDDVLTTGATLLACARLLRGAGAAKVHGLTLARVVTGGQTALYEDVKE
ncbi:ComF family protein [Parvularcula sp. LCG005]|uniref:ComF family protein n=1 Tax=Parvularcula sp. LCG005 TaxID=3078805 RepID=UPI002941D257|nr:ComF family protein [Parvularcula sp. LCG005]WOI52454.1 ComF family protein [Parvularcula sp. LCG005]